MIYKVRDKEFNIELVSVAAHKQYSKLSGDAWKLREISNDLQQKAFDRKELLDADREKPKEERFSLDELKKINQDFTAEVQQGNAEIKELTNSVVSTREILVKTLLKANGYEYDAEWWEYCTSPDDMNDFIGSCMQGDQKDNKKSYGKKK